MSKFDPYEHLAITINPDGTVTRSFNQPTVEANPIAAPGDLVISKDVTLNLETKTWVRVFLPTELPSNDNTVARLPIIIYGHHGGWVHLSAADFMAHEDCTRLASNIPAVVVSVNFRLAPESRLPSQYHDFMEAVLWVKQQATNPTGDPWVRNYGDFSRCYLYGGGSGGNIAFFTGLKAYETSIKLAGVIMNQPMFSGVRRTQSELHFAADEILPLPVLDLMWELALPPGVDRDHRYSNPMAAGPHKDSISGLGRCLVIGFGGNAMIDRQQEFVKMLVKCGVHVEACFDEAGFHNIHFVDPRRADVVINIVKEFVR